MNKDEAQKPPPRGGEPTRDMPGGAGFRNWISLSGIVVALGSLFAFGFLFALEVLSGESNAYIGILTYLVAPFFLVSGISLFFGGWFFQRWLHRSRGIDLEPITLDLRDARNRRNVLVFFSGAFGFLLVSALGSYKTYHFTDSELFCGMVCHEVMEPEYTAYQHSEHARISCAECHIGSGAAWYVKAKLNGLHQVYATITDSFDRPIDTPIPNMRPPDDICLTCHWSQKYIGNVEKSYEVVLSDKENTTFQYRMLLDVGGGDPEHGPVGGIHWHMHAGNKVEFVSSDEDNMDIPWVRLTQADGQQTEFTRDSFEYDPAEHELQLMDCMDCHNRPAHRYQPPNEAIDIAFRLGRISRELPYFKPTAVEILTAEYSITEEAHIAIEARLHEKYGNTPAANQAIDTLKDIYNKNFFPRMKVRWDAYPEHIGHKNTLGCFRCHDGSHASDTGQTISASDCNSCHIVTAQRTGDEEWATARNPKGNNVVIVEKSTDEDWQITFEGLEFAHPDGEFIDGLTCVDCHTGGIQAE